ncbi:hypothetical protein N7539_009511 [Penicillium diatomitis]|uniref:Xylanolytic transcriptional activator regulatory domain-containing protein n=1 Tax=Penicillium diatomitis TaxID=2819901 RepID=A0A9X0BIY2_9EURO|nr:uncharacterized protein N7539_009511 [Penicillium diatomitis]KAJ5466555.1 hypothetical protein N7539_009511 [Penicillium diatomitis]
MNGRHPSQLLEQMSAMQGQMHALDKTVRDLVSRITSSSGAPCSCRASSFKGSHGDKLHVPQHRDRRLSTVTRASFQGPTTSDFSFKLAKTSLLQRGIMEPNDVFDGVDGDVTQEPSPVASPLSPAHRAGECRAADPLDTMDKSEVLRLCIVYEEEMGIMYPVLELPVLLEQVHFLFDRSGHQVQHLGQAGPTTNAVLDHEDMAIIKLVLACALTAEGGGRSDKAISLLDSVREIQDDCVWGSPEIKSMTILTLVSILHFQMDEETLAWRTIGIVERMCLEKGLHRSESLKHSSITATGRDRALRLFWSIYILDMRWSFGTGMPFALEDADIDPSLPEPEESTPYLRAMVKYSRLAARVWKFVSAFNNKNEIKKDEMNYLDWQVLRWAHDIPDSLGLNHLTGTMVNSADGKARSVRRLKALLYLRANQLRMLIYRPVLHTVTHVARYPTESATVVEIAKDTIRFITNLNETSDIYQLQQVAFNWFLVSAIGVLFLAVAQAPSQFSDTCKEEFYCALDLVKGFSTHSYVSQRLWRSMRSLRKLGPRLGLWGAQKPPCNKIRMNRSAVPDPSSESLPFNTTVAAAAAAAAETGTPSQAIPADSMQMTRELMEWFEALGNPGGLSTTDTSHFISEQPSWQGSAAGPFMCEYGDELSSILRDCF